MEEKKLIPRRRFIKFRGEWNGTILQENSSLITKGTTPKNSMSSGPINFIKVENIKNGFVYPKTKISLEEHEGFLKRSKLESGDILFSIAGTLGRVSIVDESILPANTNQALAIIRGYSYDSSFLLTYLSGKAITEYIRKNPTIGAQPNLSLQQIGGFLVYSPTMKEQQKIGEFFKVLDERIANQERKIAKVKALKESYLNEMFPQEGETVPKRRFKGFEGEWIKKQFKEIADIVRGASPRPIEDPKWFSKNSTVGWLRISDVTSQNGRIRHLEQRISNLGLQKTRVLYNPHLLLSIAATVGKPVINYVKTGVHDGFLIFLNAKFDLEYMYQWLEMYRKNWKKYGQPGSQVNLNSDIIKEHFLLLPSYKEQQKIGSFFKNLDDQIRVEEARLEKLKKMKEAYLEEMFV